MKIKYTLFALIFIAASASAQEFNFQPTERWLAKPTLHTVQPAFASASAVGIIEDKKIEYKIEGKELSIYTTMYKVVKINDDKGIEMFNKIYVPVYNGNSVIDLKARAILKSGKIVDVPADKIKEIEEDGKRYKLFAMEGVEKGAEVEYMYTIKKGFSVFGNEVFQSSNIPNQLSYFTLITPQHLRFSAKGFNGFKVSADSLINERRVIVGHDENIPDMDDEKYSMKDPLLHRVEFKLSYNLSTNPDICMYTWKEFAKNAYSIYTTINSKEEKAVDAFIKKMNFDANAQEPNKILQIEDFLKTNINADEKIVGEDVDNLEKAIKTKNTNRSGIVKLFAAFFDKMNINYQFVFPNNRSDLPIDEEIENWRSIEDILFYFPKTKKFISPYAGDLRYPFLPPYLCGTRGLFLKTTTIGTLKTAIGSFGDIPMEPFEKHAHNMEVSLKFNNTVDTVYINSKQILLGYGATSYRPIYTYLPKDKQDEATKNIIKSVAKSDDITNIKVENAALNDAFDNKPLIISGDIKTIDMTERAGNKILFKIGEIIGGQEQMYQEKPRQLPIELEYPHVLIRKILVEIPEGYTIKNLKDIIINVQYKDQDVVTMGFESSYQVKGNQLEININETYRNLKYPITEFENFKKVINAAADFNKVVLVLEKNK